VRAFIVSIILILLIVSLVAVNMIYVKRVTDRMKQLTFKAAEKGSSDTDVSELMEYWEKHKHIIGISANFKQTDIVSEELLKLRSAHEFDNRFAIEQSCAILCDVLDDIAQYESFSLHAIL